MRLHATVPKRDPECHEMRWFAQLTRDGVVHMAFHPRCDTLVLAAADKGGHVGLWHIDRDSCGDAAWAPEAAATAPVKPSPGRRRSAGAG